jgi:hypothetical protein
LRRHRRNDESAPNSDIALVFGAPLSALLVSVHVRYGYDRSATDASDRESPTWCRQAKFGRALPTDVHPGCKDWRDAGGADGGAVIEIARTLGARIGIEMRLIGYATPHAALDGLKAGECDMILMGIDPIRAVDVDFSPPSDLIFALPPCATMPRR